MSATDIWSRLDPIGLAEIVARADRGVRRDRKYLVPPAVAQDLLFGLDPAPHILEIETRRCFEYETVYFDTDDLSSYLGTARSRPTRFKVRTRTYLDSHQTTLEVKTRDGRQRTVKHRLPYSTADRCMLTDDGMRFVAALVDTDVTRLQPVLTTRYRRRTLLDASSLDRVTVDAGYRYTDLQRDSGGRLSKVVVVETKTEGRPTRVDRALWRAGYRPVRFSKYGTGLADARTELPANKWRRTIATHPMSANSDIRLRIADPISSPLLPATGGPRP